MSIVHGRITLRGNHAKARTAIAAIGNDDEYPWLRSEMFSIGAAESPFYYENTVIAFAATYKSVEHEWRSFQAKFETLLRQLDFDTAKLELETEFYGSFHCFWATKLTNTCFAEKEHLTETDEWFFGYGYRTQFGTLQVPFDDRHSPEWVP